MPLAKVVFDYDELMECLRNEVERLLGGSGSAHISVVSVSLVEPRQENEPFGGVELVVDLRED